MATDFRSGRDFPRRGRDEFGGFYWLLRVFDKARAARNGTIHDYIYPCPLGVGQRPRLRRQARGNESLGDRREGQEPRQARLRRGCRRRL